MSTWIEIRCTDQSQDQQDGDGCWSADNAGPMQMANDDNASVLAVMSDLRADAAEAGWQRKKRGWVCPFCLTRKQ